MQKHYVQKHFLKREHRSYKKLLDKSYKQKTMHFAKYTKSGTDGQDIVNEMQNTPNNDTGDESQYTDTSDLKPHITDDSDF